MCERCGFPAVQDTAGTWVHAEAADAVFCAIVMAALDGEEVTRMPELIEELDNLVTTWQAYIEQNPVDRDDLVFTRTAGYLAGLQVCTDQVVEILRRHELAAGHA